MYFSNLVNSTDPKLQHEADVEISKNPLLHANYAQHDCAGCS